MSEDIIIRRKIGIDEEAQVEYSTISGASVVSQFTVKPTLDGIIYKIMATHTDEFSSVTDLYSIGSNGTFVFGSTNTVSNPSTLFEFVSEGGAVLFPRLNITDISTPADGHIAYDLLSNKFKFRENGAWSVIGGGDYLPLAGGTMDLGSHIYFGTGGQNISQGSFDNSTGGNQGISLTCAIGYELNWQGGHLSNWQGLGYQPIILDSNLQFNNTIITDVNAVSSINPTDRLLEDENGTHAILWNTSNSSLRYNGSTIFDWKNLRMPPLAGNGDGIVGVDNVGNLSFSSSINYTNTQLVYGNGSTGGTTSADLTFDGSIFKVFGNTNNNSIFTINNTTGVLTYNSNDPYFELDGPNRRFRIGDYTYDWYGTSIDINDDNSAKSIDYRAMGSHNFYGANYIFNTDNSIIKAIDNNVYGATSGPFTIQGSDGINGANGGGILVLRGGNSFTGDTELAGDVHIKAGYNTFNTGTTGGYIRFFTDNTERLTILTNGYVGINTTNPTEQFHVDGNILSTTLITNSETIQGTGGAGYIEFLAQSSNTTVGSSTGFRIFAGSTGGFNWIRKNGADVYVRNLSATLTADRTWILPDTAGTIALIDGGQTFSSATWNGSVISGQYGGTGIANTGKTITIGASLTTTGTLTPTLAFPTGGSGTYTFPLSSATLLANNLGLSGGTTLIGDVLTGGSLTLNSTSHATKGNIILGSLMVYSEVNNWLALGSINAGTVKTPAYTLDVSRGSSSTNTRLASFILTDGLSPNTAAASYAGYFDNQNSSNVASAGTYGVYAKAQASDNSSGRTYGVYGLATAGQVGYGGYFQANGNGNANRTYHGLYATTGGYTASGSSATAIQGHVTTLASTLTKVMILNLGYSGTKTSSEYLIDGQDNGTTFFSVRGNGDMYTSGIFQVTNGAAVSSYQSTITNPGIYSFASGGQQGSLVLQGRSASNNAGVFIVTGATPTTAAWFGNSGNVWIGTGYGTGIVTSGLSITSPNSTSGTVSAVMAGTAIIQTITAGANSQTLYGFYLKPTFTNGAFTGITNTVMTILSSGGNNIFTSSDASAITIGNTAGIITEAGAVLNTYASIASTPAHLFNAAWYASGTTITSKPHMLLEPTPYTSSTVTGVASTDVITVTGNTFTNGQAVYFSAISGGSGLTTNTIYYVGNISGSTFQLATSLSNVSTSTYINFTTDITSGTILSSGVWTATGTTLGINASLTTYAGAYLDIQAGGNSLFKFSGPTTSPLLTITAMAGSNNAKILFTGQGNSTDFTIGSSNAGTVPTTPYIIATSTTLNLSAGTSGTINFASTSDVKFASLKNFLTSNGKVWLIPSENNSATPQARITFGPTVFTQNGTTEAAFTFNGAVTGNSNGSATVATVGTRFSQSITPNAASVTIIGMQSISTLIASANNQILYGLHLSETFTPGAFTGIKSTRLKIDAGSATVGPLELTSSGSALTGLLTTAVAGTFEFTTYGLWITTTTPTRHKVLHGLVGATAPTTNNIGVIVDYFGTSATRVLTTPNTWISIVGDDGNTYKIPAYS